MWSNAAVPLPRASDPCRISVVGVSADGTARIASAPGGPAVDGWTVFVDRDGVINERVVGDYVRSAQQFVVLPGALDALVELGLICSRVIVVTNQAGVGRGLMAPEEVDAIHADLIDAVATRGGHLDAVLYCPHTKDAGCDCRKPEVGLAVRAMERFPDIDLHRALMIGDASSDMEFARRLGIDAILITGTGGEHSTADVRCADAATLADAVTLVRSGHNAT